MKKLLGALFNGMFTENPTFMQVLGMCPTLAVTVSAINGIGMGIATTVVLIGSNFAISLLRNIIPKNVRIPAYVVIIATFVTIVDMLLQSYIPSLYSALGIFIPLIVVNCIILGRAESFANKNNPLMSIFDGIGNGLGFTLSLAVIGSIRELIGNGTFFDMRVMPSFYQPASIFILAPGAFFVLGALFATVNYFKNRKSA